MTYYPRPNPFTSLYQIDIQEAKEVFGENFTCKINTAPHGEEFEVAVIPMNDLDEKWDNIQVCLIQYPACFIEVYLRKGDDKILRIGTRSGGVRGLWETVLPIIGLEANGAIGFESIRTIEELRAELDRREDEKERRLQERHDAEMATEE